jgi:deoxyribose-phosphate aldolase
MSEIQPGPDSFEALAAQIELPLLSPRLSEEQVYSGILLAREYGLGAVIVRPEDVDLAARSMGGSQVRLASVVSWPEGTATGAVKQYEARDLLRRGVRELNVTMSTGRMLSRQFHYIESELVQMVQACAEAHAECTPLFDLAPLAADHRVIAAKLARRTGVACMALRGVDAETAGFFHQRLGGLRMKAFVPGATLGQVLELRQAGCGSFVVAKPEAVLDEWRQRLSGQVQAAPSV